MGTELSFLRREEVSAVDGGEMCTGGMREQTAGRLRLEIPVTLPILSFIQVW
jgi:hypothetical protein